MGKQVFEGLKVADFSWGVAGPMVTRYLANYGATVVRVESATSPCILRVAPPYRGGTTDINKSAYFSVFNSNKLSLALNLSKPKGREVARKLVLWSDVVVESFGVGVMRQHGLDYESITKLKPAIIMMSTSNLGQTGPYSSHRGYGIQLVSLAGFTHLTGWPDRNPNHPHGAYTDVLAPRLGICALLSALDHYSRTGKGQYLEVSQLEAALQFLAPALLDYWVNGRAQGRVGNRDAHAAPHGVYRCRGQDRWCALAVFTQAEWLSFCCSLGKPELAQDPRFFTIEERKENEDELDQIVEEWTLQRTAEEVTEILQRVGVAAGVVETNQDLCSDPQLAHRGYFVELDHPVIGRHHLQSPDFILSKTPAKVAASPWLGQHSEYVCRDLLGMNESQFVELLTGEILE